MHISAKVMIVLGVIFCLAGAAGFMFARESLGDAGEFVVEEALEGEFELIDKDGKGELGVTFWVKGYDYVDADQNGIWDICDNTNVTVNFHPDIVWTDNKSQALDGQFYYEVMHNYSKNDDSDCNADDRNQEWIRESTGFLKIGRACLGCGAGTFNFTSNQTVWVSYDDTAIEDLVEGLLTGGAGFVGCCCGGIFLLIGLILTFTMKPPPQQMMYVPQGQPVQSGQSMGVVGNVATHAAGHAVSDAAAEFLQKEF